MSRYGLPKNIEYCVKCVMSNQKVTPSKVTRDSAESVKNTLYFENGVCEPCLIHDAKENEINWDERNQQLHGLCNSYRSKNGNWDCIVPGSGGKDSVYQSFLLREKYGMNPLTVTWAPHIYTDYGWKNFDNWLKKGGFDNFLYSPNGKNHALLTKLAYENLLHPFQPFIFGQRNYVMHMAKQLGIELIIYGENPSEYGGFKGESEQYKMDKFYYTENNFDEIKVSGLSLKELNDNYSISEYDLKYYLPLLEDDKNLNSLMPIWLGFFEKFHPQSNFYFAQDKIDFITNDQRTEGTYSRYNSLDDKIDGFHYWTGYVKFGVGRTTHEASQEVRNGDLTREEAVQLVHRYDGEFPERYFEEFSKYINLTREEILNKADEFRPEHLWEKQNNKWELKYKLK